MVVLLHVSVAALKTVVLLITVRFSEGWEEKGDVKAFGPSVISA